MTHRSLDISITAPTQQILKHGDFARIDQPCVLRGRDKWDPPVNHREIVDIRMGNYSRQQSGTSTGSYP